MTKKLLSLGLVAFLFPVIASAQDHPLDNYIGGNNTFTVIANSSDGVHSPVDLDFHPLRPYELWILSEETANTGGSTVIVTDAGGDNQTSEYRKDGNAWHFMARASSMAFGDDGNWATAQGIQDANHSGGTFTGPSLWSGDLNIYAIVGNPPTQQTNGSHLDMLHQSPYGMGIAHETGNVYWVFDGWNGNIARYDFVADHGPGQHDHSDGRIRRYHEVTVQRENGVPSHMVIDKSTGWLYIADAADGRILRLDINSGSPGANLTPPNFEPLAEYVEIDNVDWEVYIDNLDRPCGIDVVDDRLVVSDNGSGEIIIFDISDGNNPSEVGRIDLGPQIQNLMGLKIGPDGQIWFVDNDRREAIRIENGSVIQFPSGVEDAQTASSINVFPNPSQGIITLESSTLSSDNAEIEVYDLIGKRVMTASVNLGGQVQLDLSTLENGVYTLSIHSGDEVITEKVILER